MFGIPATFTVTGADSGNVNGVTTFLNIANLTGGSGDDTFTLAGGTITGMFTGGPGIDSLVADDNVAGTFMITGPDSGTLNGMPFSEIENLVGGNQADQFQLSGGSLSGTVDGGTGSDTLVADNLPLNVFIIDQADGGELAGINQFASIENLTGNNQTDWFWLAGGTLSGMIDGGMGANDSLIGDHVPSAYTIDGAGSGQATGISLGFDGIEFIFAGNQVDSFTVTPTGDLDGSIFGGDGDDVFLVIPGLGTMHTVDGGDGLDELTVNAQAGTPTQLGNMITIAPGGAVVTFFDVEDIILIGAGFAAIIVEPADSQFPSFASAPLRPLTGINSDEGETMAVRARTIVGHFTTSGEAPVSYQRLLKQWEEKHRFARRNAFVANALLALTTSGHHRNKMLDFALDDSELFAPDLAPLHQTESQLTELIDMVLEDEEFAFISF
jgi:hypothetical protein